MASFVEDLWSSIFTPGPTPTLLIATNVTFAALQLLLLALLLATASIHFLVLSFLSAGLWWSINWFAAEVRQAQAAQQAAKKDDPEEEEDKRNDGKTKPPVAVDTPGSDTETESLKEQKGPAASGLQSGGAASNSLELPGEQGEARKRLSVSGESSGYGSTDSEWEKVEDGAGN